MPPNFFQKPEAALKRAQELILVGKEQDALETLHDTIKARRHKQWSQTHEAIMRKHLELCVNLRKPHVAKDALFQYKALTQQVAVESLEVVIVHFLSMAEAKTEEAQKTSIEKVEEIDDLDNADAPEKLLLSVVSGAAAQDRMDRTVLSPWLRFLWDSYRNCLELLRNNAQVEQLYHRITRKSFGFCAKFQRRAEFRKLCEQLRLHLAQIQKHQHLSHVVKLTSADSLALMQETRLVQLDTAIQMELWQEAYRSAEDVHGMMQLSKDKDKRTVKPASYVNYYDKLALVFWKAGNRLFHAAALLQKFIIYKDMKRSFTAEEALEQATRVLLATLAIPDGADLPSDLTRHLDIEDQHIGNIRLLSNLLRLPIAPTRAGILKEAARFSVPEMASESARQLYRVLEKNFSPLRLTKDAVEVMDKIGEKPEFQQYIDSIRAVAATKTLKQISVIYETISWERLKKIIPFYDDLQLERFIVDVSKHRFVKAQLDHRSNCVRFGGAAEATLAGGVEQEESDGTFTGDDAQLGVDGIRSHLELMYSKLRQMIIHIDGEEIRKEAVEKVQKHATIYAHYKNQDYERILMRRRKIETYKETSERVKAEKCQRALEEAQKKEELRRAEEKKRLEQENITNEKRRREADKKEVEEKIRAEQMRKLLSTSFAQVILKEKGEQAFHEMDPEQVMREQRQRLDAERQQQQARLQHQERKFDHWVRAVHLEEMLERRVAMEKRKAEAPKAHDEYEARRVQKAIDEHQKQVDVYNKLQLVGDDAMEWMEKVKENRADDFAAKMDEWTSKLNAVMRARLAERAEGRRKHRQAEHERIKAEEEKRKKDEEERQKQAILDEQRRARREPLGDGRRGERYGDDSKAMGDDNWRQGPRSAAAPSSRPPPSAYPSERDRGGREPMREKDSNADRVDDWRREARPVTAAAASSRMDDRGPPSRESFQPRGPPDGERPRLNIQPRTRPEEPKAPTREEFGTRIVTGPPPAAPPPTRREMPAAAAPEGGAWERGNVRKAPPPEKDGPAPRTGAPASGAAAGPWRPSIMRNQESGGAGSAPPAASGGPPRTTRPPPNKNTTTGGADSGSWRRN